MRMHPEHASGRLTSANKSGNDSEANIPVSHNIPISIEYILKQCDTNWGHEAGRFKGESGIWCGACAKEAQQTVYCKKCGILVCKICAESLALLQRYDEWLDEETERLFGAAFNVPGTSGY